MPKIELGGGGARKRPPLPPSKIALVLDADAMRSRLTKLTEDPMIVVNPLSHENITVVPSGFFSLDDALGVNGWVQGGIHDIEGPPDSGKTALVGAAIGAHQRWDPTSVHLFMRVEPHAGDEIFLRRCGANVNPKRLIIIQPDSAEEAAQAAMFAMGFTIKDKQWTEDKNVTPVSSISWDSWGGSPVNLLGLSKLARVGSDIWPLLASRASRTRTTFFVTNHIHEKPGVSFGDPRYGTGGEKFKFMQMTRLWITPSNYVKDPLRENRKVAHDLRVEVRRNKAAAPNRVIKLHLNYYTGFDRIIDAFMFLGMRGVTFTEKDSGTNFSFRFVEEDGTQEEVKERGQDKFLEALRDNPWAGEAFLRLAQNVYDDPDTRG